MKPVSVSQLNSYIKRILATDPILSNVSVKGEISNLTKHSSGHWYFTLKDETSRINCFLPAERVSGLRFDISEGMELIVYGSVSVYERGGSYSVYVRDIDVQGEGSLKIAFENLRRKLEAEGLFDPDVKRPIPEFPKRIGVLTSPTGAAVHDIITTVKRRNPLVDVLIYPCIVQGPEAAVSIVNGLAEMNRLFPDLDVIIAGRGGGSAEDLWCFNEESVARAIRASEIPVISAVGHEVDFTIADFAADLRGATPTAAAELAVPHMAALIDTLQLYTPQRLYQNLQTGFENYGLSLQRLRDSVENSIRSRIREAESKLELLKNDADLSNPMNVLDKGYAMAKKGGEWVERAAAFAKGDSLDLRFKDGTLVCLVQEVTIHE
ncbi:MAG: exodeoxyribonuclease VII large subunit [Firmicutes bacterium]|nr:exodeoxyribonuclease VII large subunit [Bacillota bacterium]